MESPRWLAEFEPQIPLNSLVREVNNIFHAFDATHYDLGHPEINQQLPPIWGEMIAQLPHLDSWSVLDLGCGTGFEAEQLLRRLGSKVAKLTAYDPSAEMLSGCSARLKDFHQVSFCNQIEEARSHGPFNLLLTNSLLHHLPDIRETLDSLLPYLSNDAFWLAGHEPSVRFYRNNECIALLENYRKHESITKWFNLHAYLVKLNMLLGFHPLSKAADAAYRRGLFKKRPSLEVMDRIIDFHVAHSANEVLDGRGFDAQTMQVWFQRDWLLCWQKTYSYLGPYPLANAPDRWALKARRLGEQFPLDGANFSMIWHKRLCVASQQGSPTSLS